jgi:DNA-binding winged helix-turn-helix (wHTH) protein
MQPGFYIADRFLVQPSLNTLTDSQTGEINRLEPRLVQLLCILCAKPGTTILRETLVEQVWQDYAGGDEGVTQAISALRKVLQDEQKQLIRTIPKKGYVYTGSIREQADPKVSVSVPSKTNAGKRLTITRPLFISIAVLIAAFAGYYFSNRNGDKNGMVQYPDDFTQAAKTEENDGNTVYTRAPDSTLYKLVMIGDRQPIFYINQVALPVGEWEPHMPVINYLKLKLAEKRKKK